MEQRPEIDPIYTVLFEVGLDKGDAKRFAIINETIRQLATRGIEKTNFATVAKELKTIRAHIAYYFGDMDQLIDAAVKFSLGTVQEITTENIKREKSVRQKVGAIVSSVFEWGERYPQHVLVFIFFQHLCTYNENRRRLHTQIRIVGRQRLYGLLSQNVKGAKISKPRLEQLCHELQNLILGNLFECFVTNSPYSLEKQKQNTLAEVSSLLKGLV